MATGNNSAAPIVRFTLAKKLAFAGSLLLLPLATLTAMTVLEWRWAPHAAHGGPAIAVTGITLLMAAIAVRLLWRLRGQTVRQLTAMRAAFERIEAGDFGSVLEAQSWDEVGALVAALACMQSRLRIRLAQDVTRTAESARVRSALDKVSVCVMIADADSRIIYLNEAVTAMFRARADEIRKSLPSFDPDAILGSSFDAFHRSPQHQRSMLASLESTVSADIALGKARLRVVASPVRDPGGRSLGTVVQWIDRTAEVSIESEVQFVVNAANECDLTRRIRDKGKSGFFATLANGINSLIDSNAALIRRVQQATTKVTSGADDISRGNLNLSQRVEEQAASLEETASSMEEMTSTVRQNADSAARATQLAVTASEQAAKGRAVVVKAVSAMRGINEASNEIAQIIGVIDEIAFQTNLLALNAAVEAARAGEQGRGFAVVAAEVRSLASRSAAAAKQIKGLIEQNVGRVAEGTTLVDQSGETLGDIVRSVKKVVDTVSEIANASREQAAGIDEVNKAVSAMDTVTQQNAALVEEASAAAEALRQEAEQLRDMIAAYQVIDPSATGWSGGPDRRGDEAWSQTADDAAPAVEERVGGARAA